MLDGLWAGSGSPVSWRRSNRSCKQLRQRKEVLDNARLSDLKKLKDDMEDLSKMEEMKNEEGLKLHEYGVPGGCKARV